MMQGLAAFAMSARWRAVVVATLSAASAWLLPPLTSPLVYLGGAIIGLVTLRLGALQGLSVAGAGGAALAIVGAVGSGFALPMVVGAWVLWLPAWALGVLLRSSRSLALCLQGAAAFGLLLLIAAYAWLGQPAAWWATRLDVLLGPAFAAQGLDTAQYFPALARWMTALSVAALMFGALLSLLLARAWQAGLYNPGGFGTEFRSLRLGKGFAVVSLGRRHDGYRHERRCGRVVGGCCGGSAGCVSAAGIGTGACSRTQPKRPSRLVNWFVCSVAHGCAAGDATAGIIGMDGCLDRFPHACWAECLNLGVYVD